MGYYSNRYVDFESLVGKTLLRVEGLDADSGEALFFTEDEQFKLYHVQDCCERVYIEDVIGDVEDLLDTPILRAELVTEDGECKNMWEDPVVYSFYKLATVKGDVTIRWMGTSNGYYSMTVSFVRV